MVTPILAPSVLIKTNTFNYVGIVAGLLTQVAHNGIFFIHGYFMFAFGGSDIYQYPFCAIDLAIVQQRRVYGIFNGASVPGLHLRQWHFLKWPLHHYALQCTRRQSQHLFARCWLLHQ